MRKFQRSDDFSSRSVHVAELTNGQLIFFICVGLVALAVVFGFGVMVGKLDPSTREAEVEPQTVQQPTTETYKIPAVPEGENPAVTTEGESGITPTGAKRNPEKSKPQNPFTDVSPRMSSLDPLPANRPKNIEVEAPSREPRPDTAAAAAKEGETAANTTQPAAGIPPAATTQAAPPAVQQIAAAAPNPATTPPAAPATPALPQTTAPAPAKEAPLLTPITPEEPPIENLPLEPVPSTAPPASAAPAAPVSGKFGIQLVSFRGEDRRASAEALKERVKKNSGLNAEVIPSPDDQNYRVVVVGYPDKQSAEKVLGDVRTKTGFKDAFIKSL